MSYRTTTLAFALTAALATGFPGVAQAATAPLAPACAPTGNCYFLWIDRDEVKHGYPRPDTEYCYQLPDGAIAGQNKTTKRVHLYKERDCQGAIEAYVDPGYSWRDEENVYYSFDFAT